MQTRKDLLQAHRLMTQRAGLALVQGEPDTAEQPLRRMNIATFAGVMIAALVAAIFGIIGAITHAGGQLTPNASGVVVMDSDTGTSYIWCNGGELCPAVNYASARLAAGAAGNGVTVQGVSQGTLTHYPQGQEIGIPGLPSVPLQNNLIKGPWSVCVATESTATGQRQIVTLVAGRSVGGQPVTADKAVLVQAQGRAWLIWNGQRLFIQQLNVATTILPGSSQAAQVPLQWLDSLPKGSAFQAPAIPAAGQPATNGPVGATVGQVYKVSVGSTTQWFVQLTSGVAKISETEGLLLQSAGAQPSTPTISQISGHVVQAKVGSSDLPQVPPTVVSFDPAAALCSVSSGGPGPAVGEVTVKGTVPSGALQAAGAVQGGTSADRIWLPPNKGALIGVSTMSGQQSATTYFLVVGAARYALAARAANTAADLGYILSAQSVLVPVNIADLIPQGSTLDPTAARLPVVQALGG